MSQPPRSDRAGQLVQTAISSEILRDASQPGKTGTENKEENSIPLFWRVFGGTMLSISALLMINAYQVFAAAMAEYRAEATRLESDINKEVSRLGEMQSELIEKDEFSSRLQQIKRELELMSAEHKCIGGLRADCQQHLTNSHIHRKQFQEFDQELRVLREKQAGAKELVELSNELARLREKLALLEAKRRTAPAALPSTGTD